MLGRIHDSPANRMSLARRLSPVLLLALAAGCSPESLASVNGDLANAVAYRACGPADGPAVLVMLTTAPGSFPEPAGPHLRVAVYQPPERLTERAWNLVGDDDEGTAWFHETPAEFEAPTSGSVRITRVDGDENGDGSVNVELVEGTVDVVFPKAGRIRRGFRAAWVEPSQPILCG